MTIAPFIARFALAAAALAGAGCVYTDIQRLPHYQDAEKLGPVAKTKLFYEEGVDWAAMPWLVPYARVSTTYDDHHERDEIALQCWWKGIREYADVVRVLQPIHEPSGLIRATAVLCRLAPCDLGFRVDPSGMVVKVLPESDARKAGILEGDHIVSIAGTEREATPYPGSSFGERIDRTLLGLTRGGEVPITWVRPGTGRMEGKIRTSRNPPAHLDLVDSVPFQPEPDPKFLWSFQ